MVRDEFYINLYLAHHGIKGQKWEIRRYQNPDGTLTKEGRERLGYSTFGKIREGSTAANLRDIKIASYELKKEDDKLVDEYFKNEEYYLAETGAAQA